MILTFYLFQILDGVTDFSELLQEKNEINNKVCFLWRDVPSSSNHQMFSKLWEEEFLTDLTLLVGADQVPINVHKVILAANFEYFRSMFSTGLKESALTEVYLPFVGPEDLRLLLRYAYSGEENLRKENVFQMAALANYFGCEKLLNKCCEFIKTFTNLQNCVKLLEAAFQLNILQLQKNCILFIVDHLPEVNKDDLSALLVELLIEIIQHPAAAMSYDDDEKNEEQLFHLSWDKIKSLPEEQKNKYIPKVLKAIHLPFTFEHFKFFLLREVGHIPDARDLIMKAGEKRHASETREWYLKRVTEVTWVKLKKPGKTIEVDGIVVNKYSQCVLIKGFPFFVYATSPSKGEKEYHVGSPWAIEHLGLPYKMKVELKFDSKYIPVNTYNNGVVDKFPVRKSGPLFGCIKLRLIPVTAGMLKICKQQFKLL